MTKKEKDIIIDFLRNSNYIEREYSEEAVDDAFRAWRWGVKRFNKLQRLIDPTEKDVCDFVLGIHKLLMKRLRPDIAGKFRDCDVWIGGERKHFISEALLKENVYNWYKDCNFKKIKDLNYKEKSDKIMEWHIDIENIHAMTDGNGRLFRLIMNIQRLSAGLPIHIIHGWKFGDEHFHPEQEAYYGWFRKY